MKLCGGQGMRATESCFLAWVLQVKHLIANTRHVSNQHTEAHRRDWSGGLYISQKVYYLKVKGHWTDDWISQDSWLVQVLASTVPGMKAGLIDSLAWQQRGMHTLLGLIKGTLNVDLGTKISAESHFVPLFGQLYIVWQWCFITENSINSVVVNGSLQMNACDNWYKKDYLW